MATLDTKGRALQALLSKLTLDPLLAKRVLSMPESSQGEEELSKREDFRKAVQGLTGSFVTEPEAARFKEAVEGIYVRAIDLAAEPNLDPKDLENRRVVLALVENLRVAARMAQTYRVNQNPDWLRAALGDPDPQVRVASSNPISHPDAPHALQPYLEGNALPTGIKLDSQILQDPQVRAVLIRMNRSGMDQGQLLNLHQLAAQYNQQVTQALADLPQGDPNFQEARMRVRQAYALRIGIEHLQGWDRDLAEKPNWLTGSEGVDDSLDPPADPPSGIETLRELEKLARSKEGSKQELVDWVKTQNWQVDSDQDPPRATNPDGTVRIWFHPSGPSIAHGSAKSLEETKPTPMGIGYDMSGPEFIAEINRWEQRLTPGRDKEKSASSLAQLASLVGSSGFPNYEDHPNPGGWGIVLGIDVSPTGRPTGRINKTLHNPQGGSGGISDKTTLSGAILSTIRRSPLRDKAEKVVIRIFRWDPAKGDWVRVQEWSTNSGDVKDSKGNRIGSSGTSKEAGSGLYGYSKKVQGDSERLVRRVSKAALRIAQSVYDRDARVFSFLDTRARKGCRAAALLVSELTRVGALKSERGPRRAGEHSGLFGWGEKTSDLGLRACADLEREAGLVVAKILDRKSKQIQSFLGEHATRSDCVGSKLLAFALPD